MNALILSKPGGENTGPLTVDEARPIVRNQIDAPRGNPRDGWRLKIRGNEFGFIRHDIVDVMDRWESLARQNDAKGDVVVVDIMDHPYSSVARWAEIKSPVKQTSGNHDIDLIYTAWHGRYPNSRNAGICVFKGDPPSQHCDWTDQNEEPGDGANASDEFLSTMEDMLDAAAWGVAQGKRFLATKGDDGLPFGRLIIASKIWDPFQGWHPYSGNFHGHDHMEGRWWLISGSAGRC